jgi:hypothetical protein
MEQPPTVAYQRAPSAKNGHGLSQVSDFIFVVRFFHWRNFLDTGIVLTG